MKELNQEVPSILQDFADYFKKTDSVINKHNCQYMIDMYWRNKLINNGKDSDLCVNKKN